MGAVDSEFDSIVAKFLSLVNSNHVTGTLLSNIFNVATGTVVSGVSAAAGSLTSGVTASVTGLSGALGMSVDSSSDEDEYEELITNARVGVASRRKFSHCEL